MSVKKELITLKITREELNEKLAEICLTLDNLYAKRDPLVQKAETLRTRTSSLAQTLLEKVEEELKKVNKEIVQVEKEQVEVKKEIEENQQNILLRESDAGLYIQEQSSIMFSTFLEYMKKHLEDFGLKIKKTFILAFVFIILTVIDTVISNVLKLTGIKLTVITSFQFFLKLSRRTILMTNTLN